VRRARGYSEVVAGTLVDGSIGTLVTWATMPVGMLVSLRMVFAALALGVVVAVRRDWRGGGGPRGGPPPAARPVEGVPGGSLGGGVVTRSRKHTMTRPSANRMKPV
jgi:hypothetical protein